MTLFLILPLVSWSSYSGYTLFVILFYWVLCGVFIPSCFMTFKWGCTDVLLCWTYYSDYYKVQVPGPVHKESDRSSSTWIMLTGRVDFSGADHWSLPSTLWRKGRNFSPRTKQLFPPKQVVLNQYTMTVAKWTVRLWREEWLHKIKYANYKISNHYTHKLQRGRAVRNLYC
jgi:hypothetical protein